MSVPITSPFLPIFISTIVLLFVLRLPALRILRLLLRVLSLIVPPLRSSLHRNWLPSSSSLHHVLHVWSVAQILVELTDVAADVLVGLEAERNHWREPSVTRVNCVVLRNAVHTRNETEREPLPALVDSRAEVAAVLALRCDVLVAFEDGGKGVGAAGEDERHGGCYCCCVAKLRWVRMRCAGSLKFAKLILKILVFCDSELVANAETS